MSERPFLGQRMASEDSSTIRAWIPQFVPLTQPLTSTSWDGDSFSTTAKTVIDLSAVFGVPAGVRAVLVYATVRDSDSQNTATYLILSPNSDAGEGPAFMPAYQNDIWGQSGSSVIPCDANGDIYYQIVASGAGTFDVNMQIWGYWL